jgi:hypothetical protein
VFELVIIIGSRKIKIIYAFKNVGAKLTVARQVNVTFISG